MLVITRENNEGIQIGDNIKVYASRDSAGKIRLSIEAPKEINIRRLEIEDTRNN